MVPPDPSSTLQVACLCAAWCGSCRDYREVFAAAAAAHADTAFRWIDIEDEPDVLGDLDVDTFPTLLIARGDAVLFFGPLTPQAGVLRRTLDKAAHGELVPSADTRLHDLAQRARDAGESIHR